LGQVAHDQADHRANGDMVMKYSNAMPPTLPICARPADGPDAEHDRAEGTGLIHGSGQRNPVPSGLSA
jgi:hypothetical protein